MTINYSASNMNPSDLVVFNIARARDIAFDAVHALWRRRQGEGLTQAELAKFLGRDEGWVSRTLNAPGNWTLRTAATLVAGLRGELEINVFAMEDPPSDRSNFDAYAEHLNETSTSWSAFFKEVQTPLPRASQQDAFVRRS